MPFGFFYHCLSYAPWRHTGLVSDRRGHCAAPGQSHAFPLPGTLSAPPALCSCLSVGVTSLEKCPAASSALVQCQCPCYGFLYLFPLNFLILTLSTLSCKCSFTHRLLLPPSGHCTPTVSSRRTLTPDLDHPVQLPVPDAQGLFAQCLAKIGHSATIWWINETSLIHRCFDKVITFLLLREKTNHRNMFPAWVMAP